MPTAGGARPGSIDPGPGGCRYAVLAGLTFAVVAFTFWLVVWLVS